MLKLKDLPIASSIYLKNSGEYLTIEAGSETIDTPYGPVEVWGRALMGHERRTLFPYTDYLETHKGRLAVAHLALGPLKGDYLVFLDGNGNPVDSSKTTCSLADFANPGLRRDFFLEAYVYYTVHALCNFQGSIADIRKLNLSKLVSKLLGGQYTKSNMGVYELDNLRSSLARPYFSFALHSVSFLLGLFFGAEVLRVPSNCAFLKDPTVVVEDDLPVFYYASTYGKLKFAAGKFAKQVFSDAFWYAPIVNLSRVFGEIMECPDRMPETPFHKWLYWEVAGNINQIADISKVGQKILDEDGDEIENTVLQEALYAARLNRFKTLRKDSKQSEISTYWWCTKCQKLTSQTAQLPQEPFNVEDNWQNFRQLIFSEGHVSVCSCGRTLDGDDLCCSLFSKYLPIEKIDIHFETIKAENGICLNFWGGTNHQNDQDFSPLQYRGFKGEPNSDNLQSEIFRVDSPLVYMNSTLQMLSESIINDCLGDIKAQTFPLGGKNLAFLSVFPAASQLKSLWHEDPQSNIKYYLFKDTLNDQRAAACIMVNWQAFVSEIVANVNSVMEGKSFGISSCRDNTNNLILTTPVSWASVDLAQELENGLKEGLYPEEIAYYTAIKVNTLQESLAAALAQIHQDHPNTKCTVDHGKGVLIFDGGEYPLEPIQQSPEGALLRLKYMFPSQKFSLSYCSCGLATNISLRFSKKINPKFQEMVRPLQHHAPDYLSTLKTKKGANNKVFVPKQDKSLKQVFVKQCPYHVTNIDPNLIKDRKITSQKWEYLFLRDLDRSVFQLDIFQTEEAAFIAAAGPGAASMAIEPRLIFGLYEALGAQMPDYCRLEAEYENILLIISPLLSMEVANHLKLRIYQQLKAENKQGSGLLFTRSYKKASPGGHFVIRTRQII